jgi:hypothetical protein
MRLRPKARLSHLVNVNKVRRVRRGREVRQAAERVGDALARRFIKACQLGWLRAQAE